MALPPLSEPADGRQGPPKAVFCIAGTSSGVGKSSMVVGIAGALRWGEQRLDVFGADDTRVQAQLSVWAAYPAARCVQGARPHGASLQSGPR